MLTGGGARAAVVHRSSKLVFFDRIATRGTPDPKKDPDGWLLARRLPEVLPPLGRYDLLADPGETRLLPIDEAGFAVDWRAVERAIAATREGLEWRFLGGPGSAPLRIVIEGFPASAEAEPFGFEASDELSWRRTASGGVLTATLDVADDVDGFLVTGPASDLKLTVESGGCVELTLGGTRTLTAGRTEAIPPNVPDTLPRFERHGGCTGIFVWRARGKQASTPEETNEAVRKLRALGYLH